MKLYLVISIMILAFVVNSNGQTTYSSLFDVNGSLSTNVAEITITENPDGSITVDRTETVSSTGDKQVFYNLSGISVTLANGQGFISIGVNDVWHIPFNGDPPQLLPSVDYILNCSCDYKDIYVCEIMDNSLEYYCINLGCVNGICFLTARQDQSMDTFSPGIFIRATSVTTTY